MAHWPKGASSCRKLFLDARNYVQPQSMGLSSLITGTGSSPDQMQKFLQGRSEDSSRRISFEEGILANIQDHGRECLSGPFGNFRRLVPYRQRDRHWNCAWQQLGVNNAWEGSKLLSHEECDSIVTEAEAVAAWTKTYPHASAARQEGLPDRTPVESLPNTYRWLSKALGRRILPAIASASPLSEEVRLQNLRLYQATVLRYSPFCSFAPVSTDVHQDFSFLTCTVPLVNPHEYGGGGTWLEPLDRAIRLPKGHSLLHAGSIWHAGQAVTKGKRYVLALFFHSTLAPNNAKIFEERAKECIALGQSQEALQELEFSLRACTTKTDYDKLGPHGIKTKYRHELLWALVCILQLREGKLAEAKRSEATFSKAIRYLKLHGDGSHPWMVNAQKNWDSIQRIKAEASSLCIAACQG